MYKVVATAKSRLTGTKNGTLSRDYPFEGEPPTDALVQIKREMQKEYAEVHGGGAVVDLIVRKA